jgi:hypothetical protein
MGRALWIRNVITDAAAEGARMAVLPEPTDADVVAAVEARISGQGVVAPHTVQVGNRAPGTAVTVSVEADLDFLVLPRLVENALHLDKVAASAVVTGLP